MTIQVDNKLFKAAALTFETMGFMFPTLELNEMQQVAQFDTGTFVNFDGPMKGRLSLKIYGDILPFITTEILGEDDAPPRSIQQDALGELINVVCGNLLPNMCDSSEVFKIEPPQFLEQDVFYVKSTNESENYVELGLASGKAILEVELFSQN